MSHSVDESERRGAGPVREILLLSPGGRGERRRGKERRGKEERGEDIGGERTGRKRREKSGGERDRIR